MTVGAAASLTCTLTALTNPGDEVVVIAPYFPEYRVWIEKAGCTCVEALADEETFQINVDNVQRAITNKTAAIIIDSPNNPTGAFTRKIRSNAWRISCARRTRSAIPKTRSISSRTSRIARLSMVPRCPGCLRSMSTRSFAIRTPSRFRFLASAWVGACSQHYAPGRARDASRRGRGTHPWFCVCSRAFSACRDGLHRRAERCGRLCAQSRALAGALGEYGYIYVEPDGAFYLWVKALEPDAEAFCERAKKYELLAVPSNSFGVPGWFRLGYCVSYETIQNSLPAWRALAEEYLAVK